MDFVKKLIYRSHYRGTKEGDHLLSAFARHRLSSCSEFEQKTYGDLLEYTDAQIFEWVLWPSKVPPQFLDIILKIARFKPPKTKIPA